MARKSGRHRWSNRRSVPDLGNAAELTKRMFAMNKNEIGTAIQVERGYVIPQLMEIQAAHPASFEEAKDKVLPDVSLLEGLSDGR